MTNSQNEQNELNEWQQLNKLQLTAQQEQLFSNTVIDAINGSFYMLDENMRLVRWNAFLRDEITGRSETDMVGADVLEFFHPDDRPLVTRKIKNILTAGTADLVEVRVLVHGGPEICWRLITGRKMIINGKPFVIGMGLDITDRKIAEEALYKSEERFRTLFEQHSAIKILIDPDTGSIIDANHAAADFYGWPVEELRKMHIHQLNSIPPEAILSVFAKIRSSEQNRFIFHHNRADGSVCDVEVFSNRIEIDGKEYLYAIIHDITERKRYELLVAFRLRLLDIAETGSVETMLNTTLAEAEQITGSFVGFFHVVADDQTSITMETWSVNTLNQMSELKGPGIGFSIKDPEIWTDVIREKKSLIVNDDDGPQHYPIMPYGAIEVKRVTIVPVIRANKVVAMLGVGNKSGHYDGNDIIKLEALADTAWDIIARKRSELSEQNTRQALIQSQKMELIGHLAGGMAHDLNKMLGVIIGNVELAMAGADGKPFLLGNLKNILKAAESSADLTHQLLAFARKQSVMPIILDLNTMIERTLSMLRRVIGEGITIVWHPCPHSAHVKVDPTQIDQILVNLCVNARDAINGIGKITIETGIISVDKTDCTTTSPYTVPGEYVTLSVTDNGCGIEQEHLLHIFEPFFTTKEEGKGTGLGLSTVYGIVKQNNGCIDLQSKVNQGTTFVISLPRHRGYTDSDESELPDPSGTHGKDIILLVEDEPEILHLCQNLLEEKGYRVLSVTNPHDAIQMAEKHHGAIDLLLTDVVMPGMKGADLSKKLKATIPNLKTLFMSGYPVDIISSYNERYEKIHFIQKPFSFKSLITAVDNILKSDTLQH